MPKPRRQALTAPGVAGEQLAEVQVTDLWMVFSQGLPGRACRERVVDAFMIGLLVSEAGIAGTKQV